MDNNWQEWKERIVGYTRKIKQADRGQKRTRLAILFLCGLLLLVVAVPVPKTGEMDKNTRNDGNQGKERRMRQIPWQTMKNIWNRRQRRHLVS